MALRWVVFSCAGLVSSISSVAAAQSLTTNTVVHGTLSAPGQVQTYTFSADLDQSVYLSCVESSTGSPLAPRITVLNPTLTLVAREGGDERAFVPLGISSIGTYSVRIDSPGSGTGAYDLSFVQQPGPSELGALVNDGVRHETLDRGDLDTFSFSASAGETVELSVVSALSSAMRPAGFLSGPGFAGQLWRATASSPA
ncbi:MAG TPA: hypothetical protein VJU61_23605 [Polyangiaceae bacterium]|nr:hypothetical protein [Polyangiaceae bacterium]